VHERHALFWHYVGHLTTFFD